ncbi:3-carboxy-cis,cis-muconate cycloisomerase [Streptomyces sp. CcalMP-8W]|uniref:3-carboxy-cis,cis-muconate cycloisomerase n=1 Tax=Streptomyces sp. CcalMP-8W TaxID=1155715 RepID=UPI000381EF9D
MTAGTSGPAAAPGAPAPGAAARTGSGAGAPAAGTTGSGPGARTTGGTGSGTGSGPAGSAATGPKPAAPARPGIDSGILSPVRAGTPGEAATGDEAWLQAMLDAEAALTRAQAGIGTVPKEAAETVTRTARAEALDLRALAVASRETANPVVSLVAALTRAVAEVSPEAAEYVHRGSTSQDILDTGAMLVAARTLELIAADLEAAAESLAGLARDHRDTVLPGRTLALQAVPTTFGLKAAGWRRLLLDAHRRITAVLDGGLPVSLGGAAGTLAGYLEYAQVDGDARAQDVDGYLDLLLDGFAAETGLARPPLPWHSLRTPVADLGAALAFTTGALGKIAIDVQSLTRTEVGEVAEPSVAGRGASSAMPHKRNPVLATLIRSASLQVPLLAAGLAQCLVSEDERSAGVWHAEWSPLRECLRLTAGATHTAVELCAGLEVRADRMRENLGLTGDQVVTERIAAHLTPHLGRAEAKRLLGEAADEVRMSRRSLAQVLASLPQAAELLPVGAELERLCDPAGYTGAAGALVDREVGRG